MILGCDAAGVTDNGAEVLVHAVVSDPDWRDDETLDPKRSLLSERHPGTFAQRVAHAPAQLLAVPKPAWLSFDEAAASPTAWLTAYRMLFTQARVVPGQTVLVQGRGRRGVDGAGGAQGRPRGARVWGDVTPAIPSRASRVLDLGADQVFKSGGPAAVAGRRRHAGTGGRGDLAALAPARCGRGNAGGVGRDVGGYEASTRAEPGVLPGAAGAGVDHGNTRRAGCGWWPSASAPGLRAGDPLRCRRWPRPATGSPRWRLATCSARSSSRPEGWWGIPRPLLPILLSRAAALKSAPSVVLVLLWVGGAWT